ncbi:O-methyltransferase gedA [Sparassis crispa]|uniref:O-methyltransferase gedA n=1 Tax=Sparassis crispa TaxID=139825 RepID=A0A401GFG8_9APHY|nr:O-methyltransferase gedA [Sparassis crispa]GBE80928.1 O-methyltransferase gedA [Sparassis crispa]
MAPSPRTEKLLALVDLVANAAQIVAEEWEKEEDAASVKGYQGTPLPTVELYNAQRTIISACGSFTELVHAPQSRLLEVAAEYFEARALHIATEQRVADHLSKVDRTVGMSVFELSKIIGIIPQKLSRVMRTLCSTHIFAEVQEGRFANNSVSECLVNNEPLRAYIVSLAWDIYTASDKLPEVLTDPIKGASNSVTCTAFQEALGTKLARWDWLEEGLGQPDGTVKPRPALEIFGLAMLGGGRVLGTPLYYDFPWESLSSATIVDVGGGVGGMSIDLCKRYPPLSFVVQDRAPVIEQAKTVWQREQPDALESGRVKLMPHNFFIENPVKGADIYLLRYILHDWEDDRCVDILASLRTALGPHSRILIADQVMNTTLGCPELPSAPYPLLANYGVFTRFAHERDLDMMTIINGAERTPAEFRVLAERAGLEVSRIWECRGIVSITEMRLPAASQ